MPKQDRLADEIAERLTDKSNKTVLEPKNRLRTKQKLKELH
jgi:hypothetical protein